MGKATSSTRLKEDKEMSPTLWEAITEMVGALPIPCTQRTSTGLSSYIHPAFLEKRPGFTAWGSLRVRYVTTHHLKETKLSHGRYSILNYSVAFCIPHFLLCHSLFPTVLPHLPKVKWRGFAFSMISPFFFFFFFLILNRKVLFHQSLLIWFVQKGTPKRMLPQLTYSQLSAKV